MKVGIILSYVYSISGGGIETAVTLLRRELEKKGVEVYLIVKTLEHVDQNPELLDDDHIFVYESVKGSDRLPVNGILTLPELASKLKQLNLDLLHSQQFTSTETKYLKENLGIKVVHTCHGFIFLVKASFNKKYQKLLCENSELAREKEKKFTDKYIKKYAKDVLNCKGLFDLGISISYVSEKYYNLILPKDKIRFLPIPIDSKIFNNPDLSKVAELKVKYQIKESDFVLVTHSRLYEGKKIFELVRDFAALNNKNTKLIICGKWFDAWWIVRYQRKKFKFIKKHNLEDRVIFTGLIHNNELKNYFALANIGVYYSYAECQWLSYLEFLSTGKPIVINQLDAIVNVIEDGKNGLITYNTSDFVNAVNRLNSDQDLYDRLSINAKITMENYRVEDYADKTISIYKEVINS